MLKIENPKTTIMGYSTLLGSILYLAYQVYQGQPIGINDLLAIAAASQGVGLIAAKDGGH